MRITLKAYDHELVDASAKKIIETVKKNGSQVSGPVPLPTEKEIYTIQEIEQIFKTLENEPLKYRLYIMLAVYSGFRRSEMLGLEWKDIDFTNNIITSLNIKR